MGSDEGTEVGIEEDLFNMFKYLNVGGNTPIDMLKNMMSTIEMELLAKMRAQIDARMAELKGTTDSSLDPFAILEVTPNSTREEVVKAFRKKAWSAHPDRGGKDEDMIKINAAYEAIRRFKGWK